MTDTPCPTQGGTITAWAPEVLTDGEWRDIPVLDVGTNGVPYPQLCAGVLSAIGLYGYAQAMCLAYGYAAAGASHGRKHEVRVRTYGVQYDIRAWKVEPDQGGTT